MQKHALTKILAFTLALLMLTSVLAIGTVSAEDNQQTSSYALSDYFDKLKSTNDEATADQSDSKGSFFDKIKDYFENLLNFTTHGDFAISIDFRKFQVAITGYTGTADEVVIPNRIRGMAVTSVCGFNDNTNIKSVTIPENVDYILYDTFYGCTNLETIILPDHYIEGFEQDSFIDTALYNNPENWENGILYIGSHLVATAEDLQGEVTVKDGTVAIIPDAFSIRDITKVTLPEGITHIGSQAFLSCVYLEEINFPESLVAIGDSAFIFCFSLKSAHLPENVTRISDALFSSCNSLSDVTISDKTTYIGGGAFFDTAITEFNIPAKVETVDICAFDSCRNLREITVDEKNRNYVSVDGVLYNADMTSLIVYPAANLAEEFEIPATVTEFTAFFYCNNLKTLKLSANNVNYDPETTFNIVVDCENLETIYFDGTTEQWNSITDAVFLCYYEEIDEYQEITVICNDGTVLISMDFSDDSTEDEATTDEATKDETTDAPATDDSTKDETTDAPVTDEATKDEATKDEATKDKASKDEATTDEFETGDVNRDGKLNIRDVTAIQKYLAKLITFDEAQVSLADYNKDSKVNIKDATTIQKKLANII